MISQNSRPSCVLKCFVSIQNWEIILGPCQRLTFSKWTDTYIWCYITSHILLRKCRSNSRYWNGIGYAIRLNKPYTVYPKKYAHGFVVRCFVVVMQSFIMNSHEVFIHIHQGCFAGTGAIVRLPQCQWSKPDGYGKISQCITTTKHSKAKTVCIFLGIYCIFKTPRTFPLMPNQHADYDEPAHSGGMLASLFFYLRGYIRGCN